jgi:putative addiction module antidote
MMCVAPRCVAHGLAERAGAGEGGGSVKVLLQARGAWHIAVMNMPLGITKFGNFAGIVLPDELLTQLCAGPGDVLYVTEMRDGFQISTVNPEFSARMELAETIMAEDQDILRALAK